jgi:hypothetical protein
MNNPAANKERKRRIEELQQMLAGFDKSEPVIRQTAIELFQHELDTALPVLKAGVVQSGDFRQAAIMELTIDFTIKAPTVALTIRIQPPVYQNRVEQSAK